MTNGTNARLVVINVRLRVDVSHDKCRKEGHNERSTDTDILFGNYDNMRLNISSGHQ